MVAREPLLFLRFMGLWRTELCTKRSLFLISLVGPYRPADEQAGVPDDGIVDANQGQHARAQHSHPKSEVPCPYARCCRCALQRTPLFALMRCVASQEQLVRIRGHSIAVIPFGCAVSNA